MKSRHEVRYYGKCWKFWFVSREMNLRKVWQCGEKGRNACSFSLSLAVEGEREVGSGDELVKGEKLFLQTQLYNWHQAPNLWKSLCFEVSSSCWQVKGSQSGHVLQITHGTWASVMPPHIPGRRSLTVLLRSTVCLTGTCCRPKVKQSQAPNSVVNNSL